MIPTKVRTGVTTSATIRNTLLSPAKGLVVL
jgi:hypothetical protein